MTIKSSPTRYGSVAIAIHWASALAVILTFAAGFTVGEILPPGQGAVLLLIHIGLGLTVFVLTLLRIVWWLVADKHPAPPANEPQWQRVTANVVHLALYAILVLMATSGITTLFLSGAVPTLIAGGPVPDFSELIPRIAHGVMARILVVLFVLHVVAAMYHQFVRRDRLLARMGVGAA